MKWFSGFLVLVFILVGLFALDAGSVFAQVRDTGAVKTVERGGINTGFKIPTIEELLSWAVWIFFIIALLAALAYGLWGAFDWIVSAGDADNVGKARSKISAAIIGVVVVVVVFTLIALLETILDGKNTGMCLGITCRIRIPKLLEKGSNLDR